MNLVTFKNKMGLRMKNFNILGVHWKIRLLGGEFTKNRYREGNYLKSLGGAWQERGVWCFWGGWYPDATMTLLVNLQSIRENIHDKNDSQISQLLLFGVSSNNDKSNTCILNANIQHILATKRFDVPFTDSWVV